jgi:hypothetical protein
MGDYPQPEPYLLGPRMVAVSFSVTTVTVVRGGCERDAPYYEFCIRKYAAARLTAAGSISH